MDVCDFNPLIAGAHLETLRRALDLAGEVGMPILNMHMNPGVYFTLPGGRAYLYQRERQRYLDRLRALRDLVEREAPEGMTLCVENTSGFAPFEREGVALLLESGRFGLTLDVGHLDAAGGADEEFFRAHAQLLRHMHVHDVRGKENHLPLGAGEADWPAALELARAHGCRAVIEVKTAEALRASVAVIRA
jgi:sugar phosphate isomerase/epimerase